MKEFIAAFILSALPSFKAQADIAYSPAPLIPQPAPGIEDPVVAPPEASGFAPVESRMVAPTEGNALYLAAPDTPDQAMPVVQMPFYETPIFIGAGIFVALLIVFIIFLKKRK